MGIHVSGERRIGYAWYIINIEGIFELRA